MRILVADDNEAVRRGIARILEDLPGWQLCGLASDGDEALTRVRELKPDLVLLDLRMPSRNGLDVARTIKKEMPEMRVVLMSQNDAAQLLPSALNAGAVACIDKSRLASDISMLLQKIATDSEE